MRLITYSALAFLFIMALLVAGCSDRGTNVPNTPKEDLVGDWGIHPLGNHAFAPPDSSSQYSPQLLFQVRNPDDIQEMTIYIPQVAMPAPTGESRPVPLLVLLPPQDADKYFYLDRGLFEVAEELLASGEIEPMVIACLGNDRNFGGYFFGNSHPAGFYDDIIATPDSMGLVAFLTNLIPAVIDSPDKRGIGGVGMGAYGAYRAILKHPGMFSSISVTDGPLDFNGADGNSGLMDLFDDAIAEQGLTPATFNQYDTSAFWPISRLFIGGALAFSPNDLDVTFNIIKRAGDTQREIVVLGRTQRVVADSSTFITDIIKEDWGDWDFYLPFDGSGNPHSEIWPLWMDNDLEALLTDAGAGALDGVDMWFGSTSDAKWGYYDMTQSWVTTLTNNGYTPTVWQYGGYEGHPATEHQYMYYVIRKMLIFHSENFGD